MSSTITLTKEQTSAASNKRSILSLNNNPAANGTESSNKKAKMVQLSSSSFTINPITTSANTDKSTSSEKQPQPQTLTQTQQSSMQPPQAQPQTQARVSKQTQQQQQQQTVNQTDTITTFSSESTTESQQTLSNPTSPIRSQPRNRNPTPTTVSSNAAPTLTSINPITQTAIVPQHAPVVQHPQMTQVIQSTVPAPVTHQVVTQDQQQQQPVVSDQSTTVPSSTVISTTPVTNNPPTIASSFMELREMIISNTDSINYMTNFFERIQNLIDLDAQRLLVFDNAMNKEIESAIKKGLPFHNTKQFAVIAKSISASNQMNHSSMSQQLQEIQKKQELVSESFVKLFLSVEPYKRQIEQLTLQVQQYQHIISQHQQQQQQQQQHQYVLAVPQQTSASLPQQAAFDNNSNNNNNNSLNLEFNSVMDNIDFDFQHEFN
jgi:hypothetical protein